MASIMEKAKSKRIYVIHRFNDPDGKVEALSQSGAPISEVINKFRTRFQSVNRYEDNVFLDEGINEAWDLICGAASQSFDNGNAYTGVGDSNTAESNAHTGLQAASNKTYKAMDGSYPTSGTSQQAVFRSTYGSSDANYDWEEATVINASTDAGDNLCRKIQSMGTKAAATTWVLTVTLSIA